MIKIHPVRILVACDKFKGSLSAPEACEAIARGFGAVWAAAEIDCHPIADGGEGFAGSLLGPLNGRWVNADARDPLGRMVSARYVVGETKGRRVAVIEMAEASGMWRVRPDERDILCSNTFGTGELMRHAVMVHAVEHLMVGLGGSATNDGGAGMAAALGVRFLDQVGAELEPRPAAWVGRLARVDGAARLSLPAVTAACDVANPLLGNEGATRVFGPQKGARAGDIPLLEQSLEELVRCSGRPELARVPGAGAAGGLGFGVMAFADGKLVSGFELVASLTGLEDRIAAADLVITGEGSLDGQSLAGKGPVGLARLARRHGKRVVAFCGRADQAIRGAGCFDAIHALSDSGLPETELMARAAELLERLVRESFGKFGGAL